MATSNGSHDVKGPSAQDKPINVLLIGLGSIGSVYAHILERTGRVNVTAVARSNYEIYSSGKVTLDTDKFGKHDGWTPHRVVKSQAEALEGDIIYDYCLITTKCLPDINPTPKLVQEVIASKKVRAWSLIQNGLGVEEDLYQAVKHLDTPIVSSCAWIGVMTSPDGRQVTWRGFDKLVSGIYPPLAPIDQPQEREYSQKEKEALDVWHGLLKDGGAEISLEDRIDSIRFSKNVWNCSWSSVQAFIRGTPDTFVDFPEDQRAPLKAFMREVVDTGFKSGLLRKGQYQYPFGGEIGTPESVAEHAWGRIFEMSVEKVKQGAPPHKMSLLIDIEQNRPFEVEVITGAVLRLAQKHGLETPNLALIYTLMKGLQYNIVKTREQGTKP